MIAKNHSRSVVFSLLDTPAFGGAEQYVAAHLISLWQQGYDVVLATNNAGVAKQVRVRVEAATVQAKTTAEFRIINAPYLLDAIGNWKGLVQYVWQAPWAIVWCARQLWQLKKRYGAVICLWPGWSDRVTFSFLPHFFQAGLIWLEFGPLEPVFSRNFGYPKMLYRLMRRWPDHIVTISLWTLQSLVNVGQLPPEKISLIPPGIREWNTKELATIAHQGKKEFVQRGLSNSQVVGYVGRLATENQVDLAIRAVAACHPEKPSHRLSGRRISLLIIGDGPEKSTLQLLAQRLGIAYRVHFTGFVDENTKFALLSQCEVFLFPGAWNLAGFGTTIIEAMSVGVPVIAANYGPQKDIVENGKSGLLFDPNNKKDLATKIQSILSDQKLRNKLAVGGKHRSHVFDEKVLFAKMKKVVLQCT